MGLVSFHGLELLTAVGRVLTPRPASEGLVAAAIARLGDRPARIVDVGTGSGAIALAVAAALPQARVLAIDTSADAVELARANARRLGLAGRVTVRHGDLLDPVRGLVDLVLANLPYLPSAGAAARPELAGEPREAVYAPGDGLGPYRRLLEASRGRLRPGGALAIQLHRSVLVAGGDQLDALDAALDRASGAPLAPPPLGEEILARVDDLAVGLVGGLEELDPVAPELLAPVAQ